MAMASSAFFLTLLAVAAAGSSAFSFDLFDGSDGKELVLNGDAGFGSGSALRIGSGQVVYAEPIRFVGTSPGFSTGFVFACGVDGGLAFFMSPKNARVGSVYSPMRRLGIRPLRVFAAYFDVRNSSLSRVEIDVMNSPAAKKRVGRSRTQNLPKIHSWVDYNGTMKTVEVRISYLNSSKPAMPLITLPIDLSNSLWREPLLVGLSSISENHSNHNCSLDSWTFAATHGAPYKLHSDPLDPEKFFAAQETPKKPAKTASNNCPWESVMALIFVATCGAMALLFAFSAALSACAQLRAAAAEPAEYASHSAKPINNKIMVYSGVMPAASKDPDLR